MINMNKKIQTAKKKPNQKKTNKLLANPRLQKFQKNMFMVDAKNGKDIFKNVYGNMKA